MRKMWLHGRRQRLQTLRQIGQHSERSLSQHLLLLLLMVVNLRHAALTRTLQFVVHRSYVVRRWLRSGRHVSDDALRHHRRSE